MMPTVPPNHADLLDRPLSATLTARPRATVPVTFRLRPTAVVVGPFPPRRPTGTAVVVRDEPTPPDAAPPEHAAPRVTLPASHHDLFDRPLLAAPSTRMPDGAAQTQPVWCGRDGDVVVLSPWRGRRGATCASTRGRQC